MKTKTTLKILLLILLLPLANFAFAQQATHPPAVEKVLKLAGNNRPELEKAISYCSKDPNALKLKAMYFLIQNMDIHQSADHYWIDKGGKKISFNELSYPNFEEASKAFEAIRIKKPGIKPKSIVRKDIENISAAFLINNLENAFKAWKTSSVKNIAFADFCEYVLPYRVSVEPLQDWRIAYKAKFDWINKDIKQKGLPQTLQLVTVDFNTWFTNTWKFGGRKEPLPRLGAMQLLQRKAGPCEDIADLQVFAMRSQGIPASLNIIPYWATSTGSHFINTVFGDDMKPIKFDIAHTTPVNGQLAREPSKVLRMTYAKQPNTLASFEVKENIPANFLRLQNYIDITPQYWATTAVKCNLFNNNQNAKVVYASVFNGLKWKPTWWGKITGNTTAFTEMCKGIVLLPQYYQNGKLTPAGYPIAVGPNTQIVLAPKKQRTALM